MRVLIAEDEPRLAQSLARGLRRAGMAVDVALDGSEALRRAGIVDYDAVVLDRDLPEVHGDAVCRELVVRDSPPRILMLTASTTVQERIAGLDLGADDYLCKPFAFEEMLARLRALRRRPAQAQPPTLARAGITLDPARRTVTREGAPIELTRKEFGVLEALLRADGGVVAAEQLLHRVWDENADPFTNTVRVTLMTLRRKLGEPQVITTLVGAGYRIA